MFKTALLACLLIFPLLGHAKPKPYMRCLALEEAKIHKQNTGGPVYKLNQEIIGALVQLRESIRMKRAYVDKVCSAPYPSVKLLELLMKDEEVFTSSYKQERSPREWAIDQASLSDLEQTSAPLFVGFVTGLQAVMKKPGCLNKHIPQLNDFLQDMQYLQEDIGLERILRSIKSPDTIFEKIQNLNWKEIEC